MVGDALADFVLLAEGLHLVGFVVFHNAHHLFGIHLGIGPADLGQGGVDVDGAAPGGRGHDEDIVKLPQPGAVVVVDFDDDLVGAGQPGGGGADGGGQVHPPVGGDFGGFHHGGVHLAEESGGDGLGHVGKMHVHVFDLLAVDLVSHLPAALVGGPPFHGVGLGQTVVDVVAGGGAGEDPDPVIPARGVFVLGMVGQDAGDGLGSAGRGKPAEGHGISVADLTGHLVGI